MLQLTPQRTINDLVGFNGVIDAEGISTILTHHSDNLSVVAAPVRLDSPDQASVDDIGKLLDALRRMVDFVVVDTSGVFDDNALCALDRSDMIVLVGTLDIPSLKALKLATSTLDLLNFPQGHVEVRAQPRRRQGRPDRRRVREDAGPQGRLLARVQPRGARSRQPGRGPGQRLPRTTPTARPWSRSPAT